MNNRSDVVELTPGIRLDPFATRSFHSGSRGFWMQVQKKGNEMQLAGPWLHANRPLVKVIAFRDSLGWVAKFFIGPPEALAAFRKEYAQRRVLIGDEETAGEEAPDGA